MLLTDSVFDKVKFFTISICAADFNAVARYFYINILIVGSVKNAIAKLLIRDLQNRAILTV